MHVNATKHYGSSSKGACSTWRSNQHSARVSTRMYSYTHTHSFYFWFRIRFSGFVSMQYKLCKLCSNTHKHSCSQTTTHSPMSHSIPAPQRSELLWECLLLDSDKEHHHSVLCGTICPWAGKLPHETQKHTQAIIQYVHYTHVPPLSHTHSDFLIIPLQRMLDFPSLPPSFSPLSPLGLPLHPMVSI